MKKIIYGILVILLTFGIVGISLGKKPVQTTVPDAINEQIFPKNIPYALLGGKLHEDTKNAKILAASLEEGDMVFYSKDSAIPKVAIREGSNTITLGKGLFLLSLVDAYREYRVKSDNFEILHLSNGVYFIDTRDEIRVFSMTALLRMQLRIQGKLATKIEIFPSEYFVYDPSLEEKFIQVDVFRVGQLATLTIGNPFSPESFDRIFGAKATTARLMFDEFLAYHKNRQIEIQKVISKIKPLASSGLSPLDSFSLLFVNKQKKRIILENSLISLLQAMVLIESDVCGFCKDTSISSANISEKIQARLAGLAEIDFDSHDRAKNLVRKYITFGSSVNALHSAEYYGKGGSTLTIVYQAVFGNSQDKNKKVYKLLSDIYSQYFFGNQDTKIIQENLASYITFLVNSKSMGEREFLGFTYYLKEFLNNLQSADASNFKLFSQLTFIADKYIESLTDAREKFNMLSNFLFTFHSISSRLQTGLESYYFTGSTDNLILKSEFLRGDGQSNVSSDSLSEFGVLLENQKLFLSKYRTFYLNSLGKTEDSNLNHYTQLENANIKLNETLGILKDYNEYRTKMELSDKSKGATGITLASKALTQEAVTSYLENFSGVEISSLQLTNDFVKDGFYSVSVKIYDKLFKFKLLPEGNVIQQIVIVEPDGSENLNYQLASIGLDERAKMLLESGSSVNTQEEREKYDIHNFFKFTFFAQKNGGVETNEKNPPSVLSPTTPALTPEMQVFVQRQLIEKDFSIVSSFFPISIRNVQAKIVDGDYKISLSQIEAAARTENQFYRLTFSSDYIFQTNVNAFENLQFVGETSEGRKLFDGKVIQISPQRINTVDLEMQIKKLGDLIEKLSKHYTSESEDIRLDLNSNSVIIGGITYTD